MRGNSLYLFLLVGAVVALAASASLSNHPREQTAFLERFAAQIERAQRIPPETERSVREMIVSVRRNAPIADSELENRQKLAVRRIEGALGHYTGTVRRQEAPTVRPERATTVRQETEAKAKASE